MHLWLHTAAVWTALRAVQCEHDELLTLRTRVCVYKLHAACYCCRPQGTLHGAEDGAAKSNDKGRDGCCESEVEYSALTNCVTGMQIPFFIEGILNLSLWQAV